MKQDNQADIRTAFRERRKRLGLRQADMAQLLGVHHLVYARIEKSSRLTPEMCERIDKVMSKAEKAQSDIIQRASKPIS
jgi:transcriptional regulator with XRE-family HTH domain